MSKVLSIFALVAVSFMLFVPYCSLAQTTPAPAPTPGSSQWGIENPLNTTSLQTAVGYVVNVLFAIVAIVALFYLIIGGYQYLMSGGNPETQEAAKKTMGNALIGLIAVLISYLVITFLLDRLNVVSDAVIW